MMADSGEYTPETIASRQRIADQLLMQAVKPREIRHWAQGLGQLGEAALGGWLGYKAEDEQKQGSAAQAAAIASLLNGGGQTVAPSAPAAPPMAAPAPIQGKPSPVQEVNAGDFNSIDAMASPAGQFDPNYQATLGAANRAVGAVESGGNYNAMGPETKGDRAYGKHQVMGANVGPWTQEVLGKRMDPQAFMANPDAQDAVFNAKFGGDIQKYGNLADPASKWFSGRPLADAGNRQDVLGTTVPGYVNKVAAALQDGTQPPALAQVAQNAPASPAASPGGAPSDSKAQIAKMLLDQNPYVRKMGIQLGQAAIAKQIGQQPKYHKLNDEMLFEEGTGRTMAAGPGFKPLVDPSERAQHGIPADDKRPYQVGPGNKLINPPAETRLNIDQRGEAAFEQAAGKHQAERFDKLVTAGMDAKGMRADVNALKDIGSRITTGKTAQITEALGPYAEALGVKIDGLGDLQAYEAIISKLAPRMRVAGSGATSDFEMKTFLKALPGLGKTPEGNAIIQDTMTALQDHHEKAAEIGSRALNKEITPRDADKMLREMPDPLTAWKKNKGVTKLGESAPTVDDLIKKYAK